MRTVCMDVYTHECGPSVCKSMCEHVQELPSWPELAAHLGVAHHKALASYLRSAFQSQPLPEGTTLTSPNAERLLLSLPRPKPMSLLWTDASSWLRKSWIEPKSVWQQLCRNWKRLRRQQMRVRGEDVSPSPVFSIGLCSWWTRRAPLILGL